MSKSYFKPITVYATATAAQATANEAIIDVLSGQATLTKPSDDFVFVGQVKRAEVDIPGFKFSYSRYSGTLTVADAGSADLTSGDLITCVGIFVK